MKKGIQNSYSTFPSSVNMRYGNYMSNGGAMNQLTEFNEGGRHEENGLGGIPQGMNPDGQMNLVEEGETKFDAENYIFSDTLKVDKELAKAFNLNPKMIGKTFADASKMAGRKKSRREGDKIEEAANNADLMNLMEAQEAFKQKEIEERLAEISQLDPTVLPAMMGQGDPAMGGQMQEAPMMDQEAMMAQQGGPSPEEMAMMQNQMMGQQEGMMRSGGKIPKSVLLSRAKSHMSDAAAQEYVKNYDNGGGLDDDLDKILGDDDLNSDLINKTNLTGLSFEDTPTYSTGFPNSLFNFRNSPFELGTVEPTNSSAKWLRDPRNPSYSQMLFLDEPEKNIDISMYGTSSKDDNIQIDFKDPNYRKQVYDEITNNKATVKTPANLYIGYNLYGRSPRKSLIKSDFKKNIDEGINDETNKELYGEYYGRGGYMKRSYAPGGFMGMNMANANMMNTGNPVGCLCADGSTNTACCVQGYEEGSQEGITGRDYQGMFRGRNLPFRHKRALKKADVNLAQGEKVFEEGLSGSGGLRSTAPANWANLDLSGYTKEQQDKILSSELLRTDPAAFAKVNPGLLSKQDLKQVGSVKAALEWTPPAQEAGFDFIPFGPGDGSPRGGDDSGTLKGPRTGSRPVMRPRYRHTDFNKIVQAIAHPFNKDKRITQSFRSMPFMLKESSEVPGTLVARGPGKKGLRSGGKLCYGCGGAMHAYGGRLLDDNQMFDGGKIVRGLGTLMETAGNFIPVPGLNTAVSVAGAGLKNVGTGADAKEVIKDMGLSALPGVAGGITKTLNLPDVVKEKTVEGVTNIASQGADMIQTATQDQDKSQQNLQIALENASPEQKQQILKDQQIEAGIQGIASTFGNLFKPQQEETIGEAQDLLPMNNVARYGRKLGKGGGLWANIHAKRKRIAAGSGERMRKPGSKGAPTAEALRNSQNAMGGRLYYPGGYLFGPAGQMPSTSIPDPIEKQDDTYGSDMQSSFIDMSTGTNPLGLVSPMYNLGMGLFGKESDLDYPVEKFTYKPFDFTESKNALRRQAAKALDSLRKTGNTNPSNILALKNLNAQTEAAYLERAENINAQREQAAADNNTKLMNKYNKELRELRLKNEAIKDEFIKAGLQDLVGFAEQERQNEYMFNFLQAMAPDVVRGSYKGIFDIFNRKNRKDK